MRVRAAVLALLIGLTSLPAQGSASEPVSEAATDHSQRALALAQALQPRELVVQGNRQAWEAGVRATLAADAAMQTIEAAHPGAVTAMMEGMRPVAFAYIDGMIERQWRETAEILAARMTSAELAQATTFYAGSTGRRLLAGLFTKGDAGQVVDDMLSNSEPGGQPTLTAEAMDRFTNRAAAAAMGSMSAEDNLALLRFTQSDVGKKMKALDPVLRDYFVKMANKPDPQVMARQNEAGTAALLKFVDAKTN